MKDNRVDNFCFLLPDMNAVTPERCITLYLHHRSISYNIGTGTGFIPLWERLVDADVNDPAFWLD